MSGNSTPVIPPSSCEEPIYQLTPGATVPAASPQPFCSVTPTPAGPYPVAVEPTQTGTLVVSELPGTGTGNGGGSDLALLVGIVAIVVLFAIAAYLTTREPKEWPGDDAKF